MCIQSKTGLAMITVTNPYKATKQARNLGRLKKGLQIMTDGLTD